MKIAITAEDKRLESQMDSRFGRAKGFIIYDTDTKNFEYKDNSQNLNSSQGAGIQSAKNIIDSGADILITGNVGPKAFAALTAAGIKIFLSNSKTIQGAINDFIEGKLTQCEDANVEAHW
ncbi:MAG TPA: NifB/NifX family molybdenum-iron cluster-binding protein [Spirochaetota bacterium]|jgi:predicted Fe-Mo cluster-binding NifX family protein|nr:NifB/NifX family molybdenum-iron cluster-binding protein [Spirochaetota bacterium]HOK92206.1 NifB/NifX family molybdenum-iron cluster-binding protein [Spirochaetota bacterium]HON15593.1 NifB/NifX family molybdenum-iron cluster-binding protein [Spirochaetota bacterium]HRS62881.1 NifB/NifX family molybdenum-iron cluster-binding protein [Spirochaetota bacterium]HRU65157.1 NifB/NifX family molybdenum-iron cluster-binding protein [Spirochaetota bacterium]